MILKEIYIVHYSKLLKRKKSIESLFKNENVNVTYIIDEISSLKFVSLYVIISNVNKYN